LEEQCASYQNDLFALREELMALQLDVDQNETIGIERNEEIFHFLHSNFYVDGQSSLSSKLENASFESTNDGLKLLLSSLKTLASVWKSLVDKKCTLERSVAKLSVQPEVTYSRENITECIQDASDVVSTTTIEDNDDGQDSPPVEIFLPKVDSFGLETIIEEERPDEGGKTDSDVGPSFSNDQPSQIAFVYRPKVAPEKLDGDSQTDHNDVENEIRMQVIASLQSTWSDKEKEWSNKVSTILS